MNNDLISRSMLLELAHNHVGGTVDCNDIARFPVVDAEVVRHGRWTFPWTSPECSACRKTQKWTSNYCPNCGARMDGGADGD